MPPPSKRQKHGRTQFQKVATEKACQAKLNYAKLPLTEKCEIVRVRTWIIFNTVIYLLPSFLKLITVNNPGK